MPLAELAIGMTDARILGDATTPVSGVTEDSRTVEPGVLFAAVSGRTVDGHDFVDQAVGKGAAAVLVGRQVSTPTGVPQVIVEDTAEALGIAAANFLERPAEHMAMVGVTGTNGKTTTCYLMESILQAAAANPGVLGTVSYRFDGRTHSAPYTTPTAWVLHSTLREMKEAVVSHVLMEVSSHALQMRRVSGVRFHVAAYTNLTQDHLDLHGDMQSYFAAKQQLFARHLASDGTAVVWADDPNAAEMVKPFAGRVLRCSAQDPEAHVFLMDSELALSGIRARIRVGKESWKVASPLLGRTNLNNILLACGISAALELDGEAVCAGISNLKSVPGRLERVDDPKRDRATVLVDYAHTPDAIKQALATLRPLCTGRLIIVFGCGGDRDQAKRSIMGREAALGADLAVVTSDNPRTEDPLAIITEILPGVLETGIPAVEPSKLSEALRGYVVMPDRADAIRCAIEGAGPADVVVIEGKGHEDYQILGHEKIFFDDRVEARSVLESIRPDTEGDKPEETV